MQRTEYERRHIMAGRGPATDRRRIEQVKQRTLGRADRHRSGAPGYVGQASGEVLPGKGRHLVPTGDRIVIQSPGGGGLGDPSSRDPALVARDLVNELISPEAAHSIYCHRDWQAAE